jgi:ketosteroid isomerase-like protein
LPIGIQILGITLILSDISPPCELTEAAGGFNHFFSVLACKDEWEEQLEDKKWLSNGIKQRLVVIGYSDHRMRGEGDRMVKKPHPNIRVVMAVLDTLNERTKDAIGGCVSADLVYTVYGRGPFAGTYRGVQDFLRLMDVAAKMGVKAKPLVLMADGEYVFMLAKLTGKTEKNALDTENCYLYRIKDGKIIEGRNIPTDQYAYDEFCRYYSAR